ncbi:uncharacterized protein LOC120354807 [Nilaparvata lugens]|uniref:uncharacterized protein LOC120354807 n=1 Tax=Nilaparvata lugens TaxID=108931 RepID=UPI00193E2ECA|nr:uncharacterized protein LOC120354807 [Nilaparvata lugens]
MCASMLSSTKMCNSLNKTSRKLFKLEEDEENNYNYTNQGSEEDIYDKLSSHYNTSDGIIDHGTCHSKSPSKFHSRGVQCNLDREEEELASAQVKRGNGENLEDNIEVLKSTKTGFDMKNGENIGESDNTSSWCVVEFHGYKSYSDSKFYIKEFALVDARQTYVLYHFKPPFPKSDLPWKSYRDVCWLEFYHHKIKWEMGDTIYSDEIIQGCMQNYQKVFTKGREKADFLKKFHNNVEVIPEDFIKPDYNKFNVSWCKDVCKIHRSITEGRCALYSANHYLTELLVKTESTFQHQIDFKCENERMKSMKNCPFYTNDKKKRYARQGFFYNGSEVVCVYCGYQLFMHKARICNLNSTTNPINFSVLVPLI